jgi:excisionase family DNA binding protein
MGVKMQIATVREVAAFLRLKESTVSSMASQGRLPGFKVGKAWRFDMERIERLFAGVPHIDKDRRDWDQENTEKQA